MQAATRRAFVSFLFGLSFAAAFSAEPAPFAAASSTFAAASSPLADGRWRGRASFRAAPASEIGADLMAEAPEPDADESEPFGLRLFAADPEAGTKEGGLVDMPARGLFGFPLADLARDAEGLSFSLRGKAPFDGRFELRLAPEAADASRAASGTMRLLSAADESGDRRALAEGGFTLERESAGSGYAEYGIDYPIGAGRGRLPGSLLLPRSEPGELPPVVLIVPGAQADRDGNNYAVPGKSDSLLMLALALRDLGVASLRYDRRGAGEAYALAEDEAKLLFDDHIDDARAALRELLDDRRFSSVAALGFAEGALVAACALGDMPEASRASGIVALCASGKSEAELVEEALAAAPEERREEARSIMDALKGGGRWPDPSPYFADYFRPSVQPYLASLFARNVREAFAAAAEGRSALAIAGGSDLQIALGDTEILAASAAGAEFRAIPGMSHALKAVGADEEANFASFTDPGMPLAEGLAELVAAFAKGEPLAPAAGPERAEEPDEGVAR